MEKVLNTEAVEFTIYIKSIYENDIVKSNIEEIMCDTIKDCLYNDGFGFNYMGEECETVLIINKNKIDILKGYLDSINIEYNEDVKEYYDMVGGL